MVAENADRAEGTAAKIVAALERLARGQRSHRQAFASHHGLTPLQLELLATLALGPPPEPSVGLLAVELGVSQPTVTDSLRALERKGLLERRAHASDGRRTSVVLTPAGERLSDELREADQAIVRAVAALGDGQQAATLEALLTLIAGLVANGTIDIARTCFTCRFHERTDTGGHHCALLDMALPVSELRVNCREHEVSEQ